jgi:hypothetical protein
VSRAELVQAYIEGRVPRRVFIRRLVQGGISLAAALAYAQNLSPVAFARHGGPHRFYDHYNFYPPGRPKDRPPAERPPAAPPGPPGGRPPPEPPGPPPGRPPRP